MTRFACELCLKTFGQPSHLKYHIITFREGKMPFKCQFCEKELTSRCNVSKHIKACHYKITYSCGACEKKLKYKSALKSHIDTIHKK